MFKTIIPLIFLLGLLAITNASQQSSSSKMTQCYSNYAGLYYLSATTGNYTFRAVLSLRSDGSDSWIASDEEGTEQLQTTSPFYQPYSTSLGKWTCNENEVGKITIKDFNFVYPTKTVPNSNVLSYNYFYLNLNNPKQIEGTNEYRSYKLDTTHLNEISTSDKQFRLLAQDEVNTVVVSTVTGYQIDRFC